MAYPAGPGPYIPPPAPRPPRRHGALTVAYIGLAILALGGILFGLGLLGITTGLEQGVGSGARPVGSELNVPAEAGTSATLDVTLTEGGYSVYARLDSLLEPRQGSGPGEGPYTIDVDLALTGPDGEPVAMESRVINAGEALYSYQVRYITAPDSGTYRLTATRLPSPEDHPNVTGVQIRQAGRGDGMGRVLGGSLAMVLGVGAGIVGFLLFVIGGIWWLVARSGQNGRPGSGAPPSGWPQPPGSGGPPGPGAPPDGWAPPPGR